LTSRPLSSFSKVMLTLCLLRHAKSSWDDLSLDDYERPLSKRGTKAARLMGRFLHREELTPERVLCSGAVRARATLALVLPELGPPRPEVHFDDALYLTDPATILGRIGELGQEAGRLLVVGHNPGIHALALGLAGGGDRKALAGIAMEFPTAALAVLTFQVSKWQDVRTSTGRLDGFYTPRRLEG
jgi:phosphohistidine phosphatase